MKRFVTAKELLAFKAGYIVSWGKDFVHTFHVFISHILI